MFYRIRLFTVIFSVAVLFTLNIATTTSAHGQERQKSFKVAIANPEEGIKRLRTPITEKTISLYNTHTGERVTTTFWRNGEYVSSGLEELNNLLVDHRAHEVTRIDPELFSLLYDLQTNTGTVGKEIEVISGYRSLRTNNYLKSIGRNVAKNSQHTHGKAIDIRIKGYSTKKLRQAALDMGRGGVGFYPRSDFVHVDTGRPRQW